MLKGLTSAFVITICWVSIQIVLTYLKKPRNHFNAIFQGYLISLPFVALFYIFVPLYYPFDLASHWPDLIHAYLGHFLMFLLYFESFKHLARSITLSFLIELFESPQSKGNAFEIQKNYSLDEMINKRLGFLEENEYIVKDQQGRWNNTAKGDKFTKFAGIFIKIFRSKTQKERN